MTVHEYNAIVFKVQDETGFHWRDNMAQLASNLPTDVLEYVVNSPDTAWITAWYQSCENEFIERILLKN